MADVVYIKGLDELEKMLTGMPDQFNYKFLTGTHKDVFKKTLLPAAKALAPVLGQSKTTKGRTKVTSRKYPSRSHEKGNLANSINVGLAPKSRTHAGVWCGPTANVFKGKKKLNAFYAHMVEFGHNITKREGGHKAGMGGTYVPAKPFMRPAFDQTRGTMQSILEKTLIERMNKQIKKWNNASR